MNKVRNYKCKRCESTNINLSYYRPDCIGVAQKKFLRGGEEKPVLHQVVIYTDVDEVQLTKCLICGNLEDYGIESID